MRMVRLGVAFGAVLVALATAQGLGIFGGGSPSLASPGPVPIIIPIFFGFPAFLMPPAFAGLFVAWVFPAIAKPRLPRRYPIRSWILLAPLRVFGLVVLEGMVVRRHVRRS
jgi:hypothetical protein